MKRFISVLLIALIASCQPDEDLIQLIGTDPLDSFAGDYSGWVTWKSQESGNIHLSPILVKVESVDSLFFVTSTDPPFEVTVSGFGSGISEKVDTTFVYSEKDTSGLREIIDTILIRRVQTEELQIEGDKMDWTALLESFIGETKTTSTGRGELQKIN